MAKRPDYRLKLLNKETDEKNMNAGAGWENPDGSISITLAPCVHLKRDVHAITLFPIED